MSSDAVTPGDERTQLRQSSVGTEPEPVTETERASGQLLRADSDQEPTLSVVLPTLNEEAGVAECIERIETAVARLGVTAEVVVSDSSSDRTPEIAREMGARVVEPDRPGYGYAYRYAFERARGEYIAMGDADTTYDFEELPVLFHQLLATDADMVLGSRLKGEIKPGAMPSLHQYVGNPVLTRFLNTFYDAGVSDAHSGMRVFTRDALAELTLESDGMEFASEMIMDASATGLTIAEVPITYHEREGEATLESFRDGWRHVRFMLANAPGYLFSVPGMTFASVGAMLMTLAFLPVELAGPGGTAVRLSIRTMIAGSLLSIVGVQVASMGVFSMLATDPIRRPEDPVTTWLTEHLSLKTGALAGFSLFAAGGLYAGYLIFQWVTQGYGAMPPLTHDTLAFTLIVLGLQVVFTAFFLRMLSEERD